MAKIIVPTPLRQYAGKQEAVDLSGATVGELLEKLTGEYGDLRRHLYTDDGKLRSFVNVYVNDEDIRYMEKENTPVQESDVVSIVPSIAGGKNLEPQMNTDEDRSGPGFSPAVEQFFPGALAPEEKLG